MKRVSFVLLVAAVLALGWPAAAQDGLSRDDINRIATSVVQIIALENGEPFASGSGTIVDATGLIFTNRHVIEDADDYAILMIDDLREAPVLRYFASLVGASREVDFAVLQIDRDDQGREVQPGDLDLPIVDLGSQDMAHGDRVYIFGFPDIGDGYLVLTQGTITTIENGDISGERLPVWYQTDAEISPGNSGGLVVNELGEFVGIPTAVQSEERTLGRLGGILPIVAVSALLRGGDELSQPEVANNNNNNNDDAQPALTGGVSVQCDDGVSIENGVEIVIRQMRAGFTYTATAIGLNGFDPVLAVYNPDTGRGRCSDDEPAAAGFEASLPTTGPAAAATTTSQVQFSQGSGQGMADVSLAVGGFENATGEVILMLEGMAATQADGKGDPFMVRVTPGMVASGVPLTVYMISKTTALDPFMYVADDDFNPFEFSDGTLLVCDDAGADSCWGESNDLSRSFVPMTNGRLLPGGELDSMLSIPVAELEIGEGETFDLTFLMTSFEQTTFGDYIIAFHIGTR